MSRLNYKFKALHPKQKHILPASLPFLQGRSGEDDCPGFRISKSGTKHSDVNRGHRRHSRGSGNPEDYYRIPGQARNDKLYRTYLVILTLFLVFLFPVGSGLKAEEKRSLAILPFIVEKAEDPARGAVCSICKGVHTSSEIVPGSQNKLTQGLYGKLEALGTFEVVPLEKVEKILPKGGGNHVEADDIPSLLQLGKELSADFVMVGILFRFEERIGSSIGVEKPASVAFDLHLFRLRDGARVWDATFDETQKPLSDNLFQIGSFFRHGAKWLTAEELAGVGINEVLKKLPEVKELEEKP